ncbi:MAG TPA: hypothetical protein PK244_06485 [Pseudomonadales bacterium]|nr:hypothetical protein [Pseudomonadales bacterium]
MRHPQKSASEMALIRIAFIAKNYAAILQQTPEYLVSVLLVIVVWFLQLAGVLV